MRRLLAICATGAMSAAATGDAQDLTLDLCIAAHQLRYETPQTFEQSGSVTCPASRLGGFPPREIKSRRTATVSFVAPDGMIIDDRDGNAPTALSGGGPVAITLSPDKTRVTAPVTCESAGIKAGTVSASVTITGQIIRQVTEDLQKDWLVSCALAAARRR